MYFCLTNNRAICTLKEQFACFVWSVELFLHLLDVDNVLADPLFSPCHVYNL